STTPWIRRFSRDTRTCASWERSPGPHSFAALDQLTAGDGDSRPAVSAILMKVGAANVLRAATTARAESHGRFSRPAEPRIPIPRAWEWFLGVPSVHPRERPAGASRHAATPPKGAGAPA